MSALYRGGRSHLYRGRSGGSDPLGQSREGLDEMAASEKRVFRHERAFIPSMLHRVDALAVDVLAAPPRYFLCPLCRNDLAAAVRDHAETHRP